MHPFAVPEAIAARVAAVRALTMPECPAGFGAGAEAA
jgi:hypothetical protein